MSERGDATGAIRILQVGDVHAGSGRFSAEMAAALVDDARRHACDALALCGDITDGGAEEHYAAALGVVDELRATVGATVVVPGNRDAENVGLAHFDACFGAWAVEARVGGRTVAPLVSAVADLPEGYVETARLDAVRGGGADVLVTHHHLVPVPGSGRERSIVRNAGDVLRAAIEADVRVVLAGHVHVPWRWDINGMSVIHCGTACSRIRRGTVPPGYNVVEIGADRTVSAAVYEWDGSGFRRAAVL